MKKLLLFTILILVATASAAYVLTLFDNIVHGTLYNYGLQFSYDWANPYWTLLRTVQVLIGMTAALTVINLIYVYRKYIYTKSQVSLKRDVKKVMSPSIREPEPARDTQRVGVLVKCTHCNRVFSQPLRMLDFHSDRPRIINICPFCNEVIPPILRHEEAEREGKKTALKGKKNDQVRESREILQRQGAEAAEESVAASA